MCSLKSQISTFQDYLFRFVLKTKFVMIKVAVRIAGCPVNLFSFFTFFRFYRIQRLTFSIRIGIKYVKVSEIIYKPKKKKNISTLVFPNTSSLRRILLEGVMGNMAVVRLWRRSAITPKQVRFQFIRFYRILRVAFSTY